MWMQQDCRQVPNPSDSVDEGSRLPGGALDD
jgi:hypothetical protein